MKPMIVLISLLLSIPVWNDGEKIVWDESRKLSWSDFQGRPVGDPAYVASTNSGISFSYSIKGGPAGLTFDYTVRSNFYPQRSWYRPELVDDYILAHEQTHFDITELFARKLRSQLAQLTVDDNIKNTVETLYAETEDQRRAMQAKYDLQTDHSKNSGNEYQWRAFVAQELKRYEAWK